MHVRFRYGSTFNYFHNRRTAVFPQAGIKKIASGASESSMKRLKEINLEEGKPTVADALMILKSSIGNAKSGNVGCLYIIHGYGSSGKGGAIREKARQWLNAQARNGDVKCVINGEDFDLFNVKALELKNKYKELEQLLKVCNHGVTVVEF